MKISKKKMETIVNVADWGLSTVIVAVGYLVSRYIGYHIWSLEVSSVAKWVCCICGCGLGMLGVILAISKRDKNTKALLAVLVMILILVTAYGVVAARSGVDASSMIATLALQLIVGAIVMLALLGCSEGMNRVRRKLFGNMAKVDGVWYTFYEVHS